LKTIHLLYDSDVIHEPEMVANLPLHEHSKVDIYSQKWFPINFDANECAPDYHLHIQHLIKKYYPEIEIQFVTTETLQPKDSFIYPINFKFFHSTLKQKNLNQIFNQLHPIIQKSLQDKNAWILLNDSHEYATYLDRTNELKTLPKDLNSGFCITSGNLDNEKYVGTNLDIKRKLYNLLIKLFWSLQKPKVAIHGFRFFEEVVAHQMKTFYRECTFDSKLMQLQKAPFKTFICLNNVIKQHRVALSFLLYESGLQNNFISQKVVAENYYSELKNTGWSFLIDENKWEGFNLKLPIKADNITPELQKNPWNLIPFELVNQSFFWLVTETLYEGTGLSRCFFTEKLYKPISLFMPFVVVAQPYTLYNLKKEGYQTFSKWWDESYDLELHPQKRMEKILKVVKFISNKSNAELISIYKEMETVLKHNYNRLANTKAAKPFIDFLVTQYFNSK
jgi:hypothetical protein